MDFSLDEQLTAMSGLFLDPTYNGTLSHQTSFSTLSPGGIHSSEPGERGSQACDAIWLWIAILATVGNILVVAVVCVFTF
ncbi:uncharacterized protein C14orf132 homolog [Pelodytes ibericus]